MKYYDATDGAGKCMIIADDNDIVIGCSKGLNCYLYGIHRSCCCLGKALSQARGRKYGWEEITKEEYFIRTL